MPDEALETPTSQTPLWIVCLPSPCLLTPHVFVRYGAVMLDEAHERAVHTDLLLGLVKRAATERLKLSKRQQRPDKQRPGAGSGADGVAGAPKEGAAVTTGEASRRAGESRDEDARGAGGVTGGRGVTMGMLRVLVTSATLDIGRFQRYFGGDSVPALTVPGRTFPVAVFHSKQHQVLSFICNATGREIRPALLRFFLIQQLGLDSLCLPYRFNFLPALPALPASPALPTLPALPALPAPIDHDGGRARLAQLHRRGRRPRPQAPPVLRRRRAHPRLPHRYVLSSSYY